MKHKKLLNILLVLVLIFIWGNSVLPRSVSGAISDTIMNELNTAAEYAGLGSNFFSWYSDENGDGVEEETSHLIRKAAHVTEFAALGALLYLRLEKRGIRRFLYALLLGAAAAGMDETIQIFSGRGHQLKDVGIDTCGVLLGLAVTMAILAVSGRKKAKTKRT